MTETSLRSQRASEDGRRLASWGYAGLVALALWFWSSSPWEEGTVTLVAVGILAAGIVPILQWLKRSDASYPVLEIMQLAIVPFYAVPLLTEHDAVAEYPTEVLLAAGSLVLVFQLSLMFGGLIAQRSLVRTPQQRSWWTQSLTDRGNLGFSTYTLMLTTAWFYVLTFTRIVPPELIGTLRAIFFGIGIISAFIQSSLWGAGMLRPGQKALLVLNISLQILFASTSLILVTGIILLMLTMVGYFSTARRVPWLPLLVAIPVLAVLHNGKRHMRLEYWVAYAPQLTVATLPDYYLKWIGYGLAPASQDDSLQSTISTAGLLQRASLFQIACLAVDRVPERIDYLGGESYDGLLPQVVPRFLWPDKPSPNNSVKILSTRLQVLTAEQAESTSIGYGLIAEAYVNFGFYGAAGLGLILGWALRTVALRTAQCAVLSIGGVFRILATAWCLNSETTLLVWTSSFYQACWAVVVPLVLWRKFSRG